MLRDLVHAVSYHQPFTTQVAL